MNLTENNTDDRLKKSIEPEDDEFDVSKQWIEQHEDLKRIASPFHVINIEEEMKTRKLDTEFRVVCRITETNKQLDKIIDYCPIKAKQNRYASILPYKFNNVSVQPQTLGLKERVALEIKGLVKKKSIGDQRDHDNRSSLSFCHEEENNTELRYINASYIRDYFSKDRLFIASQAPIEANFDKFWRMIWNEDIRQIFCLSKLNENGKIQTEQYWPTNTMRTTSNFQVRCMSKRPREFFVRRVLEIKNKLSNDSKVVTHYQVLQWPDKQAPPAQHAKDLERLRMYCVKELEKRKVPVLVHCSAGIGRSGTFMAIVMINKYLRSLKLKRKPEDLSEMKDIQISIFDIVRHLREMRWGTVQKEAQYRYIYQFLEDNLEEILLEDE